MKTVHLFLALLISSFAISQDLKVMSYNIRYDNPGDGMNAWQFRKDRVADMIQTKLIDIAGLQEALSRQIDDLTVRLDAYAWIGVGRDDGKKKGEFSPIFYLKDKYELLENGTFWLSKTPEVPGSKDWDAAITRIVTWAKFKDKTSELVFYFFNTHFDHKGEQARMQSVKLLRQKIDELAGNAPVIITGDFNFTPYSEPFEQMTNEVFRVQLFDTYAKAERKDPEKYSFYGFDGNTDYPDRIDYIFINKAWKVGYLRIFNQKYGATFPSDHLPVYAEIELKN